MIIKFIKENKTIVVLIAIYFFLFTGLSCLRHYSFQTQTWDLAAFEQSFWNTVHGKFMWNNFEGKNHFAIHFSPILLLLLPLYFIWQSPYLLFIMQSLALAIAGLPLYLMAKSILDKKLAIVIAVLYLSYPSLHWINLFDFHAVPFAIPLIFSAFYFLHKNNYLWATIFLILTSLVAENMIVAVFFVGIYLLFKNWKYGLAVALLSLVYFIAVSQIIMPAFGGGIVRLDRYSQFGSSAAEIIINVITNPGLTWQTVFQASKGLYLLKIFLSAAFLNFLAWPTLILLIPGLLQNLLTNFDFQFSNFYQYDSILVPFIMIGAIYGLKKIANTKIPKKITLGFIGTLVAIGFFWNSPLSPWNFPWPRYFNDRNVVFQKIINTLPSNASVAAHTNLVPHLTHREHIYMVGYEPFLVDYVVVDGEDVFAFPDKESFEKYLDNYRQNGQYEIVIIDSRYFIIKKQ